jgi:hypothetical protein
MEPIFVSTVEYFAPNRQVNLAVSGSSGALVDRQKHAGMTVARHLFDGPVEYGLAKPTAAAAADQLDDLRLTDVVQVVVSA